jgi:hypothetical protein
LSLTSRNVTSHTHTHTHSLTHSSRPHSLFFAPRYPDYEGYDGYAAVATVRPQVAASASVVDLDFKRFELDLPHDLAGVAAMPGAHDLFRSRCNLGSVAISDNRKHLVLLGTAKAIDMATLASTAHFDTLRHRLKTQNLKKTRDEALLSRESGVIGEIEVIGPPPHPPPPTHTHKTPATARTSPSPFAHVHVATVESTLMC